MFVIPGNDHKDDGNNYVNSLYAWSVWPLNQFNDHIHHKIPFIQIPTADSLKKMVQVNSVSWHALHPKHSKEST